MKGLDVLIVRFLPFILFIIFGINVLCCYSGIDITNTYNLHGNSSLYALALFLISLSNKKYHCKWNRAMYIYMIIVPIFNYLDSILDFFENFGTYLLVLNISYLSTALITAYLAIKHFVDIRIKKLTNGN